MTWMPCEKCGDWRYIAGIFHTCFFDAPESCCSFAASFCYRLVFFYGLTFNLYICRMIFVDVIDICRCCRMPFRWLLLRHGTAVPIVDQHRHAARRTLLGCVTVAEASVATCHLYKSSSWIESTIGINDKGRRSQASTLSSRVSLSKMVGTKKKVSAECPLNECENWVLPIFSVLRPSCKQVFHDWTLS